VPLTRGTDVEHREQPLCAWRINRIKRLSEFGTSLDSASATKMRSRYPRRIVPISRSTKGCESGT
jgi:hypothetical protein